MLRAMTRPPNKPVRQPQPGFEICYDCWGNGTCMCRGEKLSNGNLCPFCFGDATCPICDGAGEVPIGTAERVGIRPPDVDRA